MNASADSFITKFCRPSDNIAIDTIVSSFGHEDVVAVATFLTGVDVCAVLAIYEVVPQGIFAICHVEVFARVFFLDFFEHLEEFWEGFFEERGDFFFIFFWRVLFV